MKAYLCGKQTSLHLSGLDESQRGGLLTEGATRMLITRRNALRGGLCVAGFSAAGLKTHLAFAQRVTADPISRENVLNDPAIPAAGNPSGDITIVEYFDYQCPYCKKVHPELSQVVKEDGKVRVVFKNWPIFGGISITAARLVMASQYQNKYVEAHEALMTATNRLTELRLKELLVQAGVDVDRADADLVAYAGAIDAALKRNDDQAKALGFQGTPAFIIGSFRVPGVLDKSGFRQAIADARAAAKK
jgi:protein-disulfide isomerase